MKQVELNYRVTLTFKDVLLFETVEEVEEHLPEEKAGLADFLVMGLENCGIDGTTIDVDVLQDSEVSDV